MGNLVGLPTRRLEEDCGAYTPVDVSKGALGVHVECLAVRLLARYVGIDRRNEPRLTELPQNHAAESGLGEGRRAERDERLGARLTVTVLGRKRDPLRQHRQSATRLLVLRQGLPLALEHRQRGGVERVAGLESTL